MEKNNFDFTTYFGLFWKKLFSLEGMFIYVSSDFVTIKYETHLKTGERPLSGHNSLVLWL